MSDGVYFDQETRSWFWEIGDLWKAGFASAWEAGQDYVVQLIDHCPEVREHIHGKSWRVILKCLDIAMPSRR